MNNVSYGNLQRLMNRIRGDMSAVAAGSVATFEEVYKNMEALDERIEGVSYSAVTETITIPTSIGSFANETIILK